MLIEELLGQKFILEDSMLGGNVELQKTIDDILLLLRNQNYKKVDLNIIADELRKATNGRIYIDPTDHEFRNTLIDTLTNSGWVENVVANTVYIKDGNNVSVNPDNDAGDDADAEEKQRKQKANKIASKHIKDKAANKAGGLT